MMGHLEMMTTELAMISFELIDWITYTHKLCDVICCTAISKIDLLTAQAPFRAGGKGPWMHVFFLSPNGF